jgi:hypothetical protein
VLSLSRSNSASGKWTINVRTLSELPRDENQRPE